MSQSEEWNFPDYGDWGHLPPSQRVNRVMDWLGLGFWDAVSQGIREYDCTYCFAEAAKSLGVTCPATISAWYDLYQGQGAWESRAPAHFTKHEKADGAKADQWRTRGRLAYGLLSDQIASADQVILPGFSQEELGWFKEGWAEAQAEDLVYGGIH